MIDWNYLILSRIKKILNSISSIQNLLSSTQKLIGTTTDIGGNQTAGTLMAKENAILSKLEAIGNSEVPTVKSIQRGYVEVNGETTTIQISAVDVSKAFVTLSGFTASGTSNHSLPWITKFTPTSIIVSGYGKNGAYSPVMRFSWQVIEFY